MHIESFPIAQVPPDLRLQVLALHGQAWPGDEEVVDGPAAFTAHDLEPQHVDAMSCEPLGDARQAAGPIGQPEPHETGTRRHGAARDRFMTHIAMLEVDDDGNPATWGDEVTEEDYAASPEAAS